MYCVDIKKNIISVVQQQDNGEFTKARVYSPRSYYGVIPRNGPLFWK